MVDAVPELHRPWLDDVLIRCPGCARPVRRIPEVGDCWLDAGIVPFSTLGYLEDRPQWERWFPADFIVEAVGQLRGWFYAMLFMSTALEGTSPYRTVLAHERVLAGDGREMHKSWGNAVWLDDALEKMGPDVIRHMFASQTITEPIRFGFEAARDVKRRFLTFWNVYSLFVTYANLDRPPLQEPERLPARVAPLEQWLLSRLQATIAEVRLAFDTYQIRRAVTAVDAFIHDDLSNWYVRRRRREFWKGALGPREAGRVPGPLSRARAGVPAPRPGHAVRHRARLPEPGAHGVRRTRRSSLHLTRFPEPDPARAQPALEADVAAARRVLRVGLAARNAAGLKVRKPLGRALLVAPPDVERAVRAFEADILDELNVERLETVPTLADRVALSVELDVARHLGPAAERGAHAPRGPGGAPGPGPSATPCSRPATSPLPVGDVEVRLGWADLDVPRRGPRGFAAAADREVIVALDTTMTPDLQRKALARHLVHQIQLMRKEARLNVDDRIRVSVDAHGDVRPEADAIADVERGVLAHQLDLVDQVARQRLPLEVGRHRGVEGDDHLPVGRRREAGSALDAKGEILPTRA